MGPARRLMQPFCSNASAKREFPSPVPPRAPPRRVALRVASLVAALLLPAIAAAHAILVSAQPAMDSVVAPGEIAIRLQFNSRIDDRRSTLILLRPDGVQVAVALSESPRPGVLAARARVAQNGPWKLRWQVLSLDGHITRGEVNFSVLDAAGAR